MPTEVLYRKWRPQRFADVAGQDIVTRTLTNAVTRARVSHAYLFSGPRGTGKTTMGRLLAKAVNCERNAADASDRPGEPCNECVSCLAFTEGRAFDLVELDAASNRGIDEIRDLRERTNYAPAGGESAHKVYLIDEVHMLTDAAFNALLKTLEEPPPHVIFILATTDAHKVPPTIVSRCQRHDFKRIPLTAMVDRLAYIAEQEGIGIQGDGLELVARAGTGSLRDAINLLEQVCDSYGKDASLDAVRESLGMIGDERAAVLAAQALRGDLAGGLQTIADVRDDGIDLKQFQKDVVLRLRELLMVQSGADVGGAHAAEQVAEMQQQLTGVPPEKLVQALKMFGQADLRADPLSSLPLELALAESTIEPAASTAPPSAAPQAARPRPQAPAGRPLERPAARAAAAPREEQVPAELRKEDISKASAEEIAAMLGSKKPVIPPAGQERADAPAAAPATGDSSELGTIIQKIRAAARPRSLRLDALLNGSCHAISWEGGVLTLGFYEDAHHKKSVEQSDTRKVYEEIAAGILGAPVSIRCIIAERPARTTTKSRLVQHAVENHGAKIVSQE